MLLFKNIQWTWEKAFEYSEIIYNCTGNPGFRIIGSKSEGNS